jgi:hypothetical protein
VPPQQQRLGVERLLELDPAPLLQVLAAELTEPAAEPEPLFAVRVLDHSIERHVRADHELSHVDAPLVTADR